MKKNGVLFFSLLVAISPVWGQEVFVFQDGVSPTPDYAGTQDAHIIAWDNGDTEGGSASAGGMMFRHTVPDFIGQNAGNTPDDPGYFENPQNIGGSEFLQEGNNTTGYEDNKSIVIQFDLLDVIPANRSEDVTDARIGLYLNSVETNNTNPPHTLYINRILKRWAEGDGTPHPDGADQPDNEGAVTWNSTGFELWQAIGATGPEDVAPPESETLVEATLNTWFWFNVTESAKIWIADPSQNHGVKISQEAWPESFLEPDLTLPDGRVVYSGTPMENPTLFVNSRFNFRSSEHTDAATRPQLVIELSQGQSAFEHWSIFQ